MENKKLAIFFVILSLFILGNLVFFMFFYGLEKSTPIRENNRRINNESISSDNTFISLSDKLNALSTKDFIELDVEVSDSAILTMRNKNKRCEGFSVTIDPAQAYSIQQGKDSKISFRPLSHDVIRDILEQYNISVVMVKIVDFKNGIYIGKMILKKDEKIVNLDIRPSDGIAIAVRTNSPIYISKNVFESIKENLC